MDKPIIFLISFIAFICLSSCYGQDEVSINLKVYNKSGFVLDSVIVTDIFNKRHIYYNIKPDSIIAVECKGNKNSLPKGESSVFATCAFKEIYFYCNTAGFIGFPTARLENEYELYIRNKYVTPKKDFINQNLDSREYISEYITEQ